MERETPMWPYLVAYEVRNSNGIEPILEERLLAMNGRKLMDRLWLVVADEGASYVLSRISPDLSTSD